MNYAISTSYGNDSTAMIQWAAERGLQNVTVVYCDTGWAAPGWDERVTMGEQLAKRHGFDTVRLMSIGMADLVRHKRGFPGNGSQFCTAFLKGLPFLQWIDESDPDRNAVVMVGKRREESQARASTPEWVEESEYHGGRRLWHPLYLHTLAERDVLLMRAGVPVLPHRSDECSPCVNANRDDIRRLSRTQREKLGALEREIGQPMFRANQHGGAVGIEEVVRWAGYGRGKYKPGQADIFETGCGSPFGCGL